MKRSYAVTLSLIVLLLTVSLSISASYGLWRITSNEDEIAVNESGCFEIIYNNGENISIQDFKPLNIENGKATTPYTFAITNTCNTDKTAEIRLNILDNNTLDTKGFTVYLVGDIDLNPTLYSNLKNSRTTMTGISNSKIISSITVPANSTVRSNLKMWIDEKIVSSVDPNQIFKGVMEITDKESIILPTFKETILENNGGLDLINNKGIPNFNSVATNEEGLYITIDQDGASYYFRGASNNNYVSFAGLLWRIVRINGDETIRLILQDSIPDIEYNQKRNSKDYVGYTYMFNDSKEDSHIKQVVEKWYQENITNKNLDDYVSLTKYCNDTNNFAEYYHYYFEPSRRVSETKTPNLICQDTQENYGGNYRFKVGLLTIDEAIFAGAALNVDNPNIYLNNGTDFYTMSPSDYYNYSANMEIIKSTGAISSTQVTNKKGLRPVISLKANTVVIGDGTVNNPYQIDIDANK